jgi:hypothetical protein
MAADNNNEENVPCSLLALIPLEARFHFSANIKYLLEVNIRGDY